MAEPVPILWHDDRGEIRVMSAPIDGYVMMRRRGCMPFVVSVKILMSGKAILSGPIRIGEHRPAETGET